MENNFTDPQPDENTPINMAALYYLKFQRVSIMLSDAKIRDDLITAFRCLEQMYSHIGFKLKDDELLSIRTKLELISMNLSRFGKVGNSDADNFNSIAVPKARRLMVDVEIEILKCMHRYKMLFPNIENYSGIENFKKRLGLKE